MPEPEPEPELPSPSTPPTIPLAARAKGIAPFRVMELLARARQMEAAGRDIVHMEVGEPDFPSPAPVLEAGARALQRGLTHYTPACGLPRLREAVAQYYADHCGAAVAAEQVVMAPGASGALQLALGVLVEPGDRVLLADPGYPCNRHLVTLYGGIPVGIPVDERSGYQLTAALVEQYWDQRTRVVVLSSPANPTGTLVPQAELEAIHAWVLARGGQLVVDEIYHGLVYDGQQPRTAVDLSPAVFVVNSFSKYFGMTGWRLGWCVAPAAYVRYLDRLAQNLFLAPSTLSQHAALAAFEPDTLAILEQRRCEFERRRELLLPALRGLGFAVPVTPAGAFYIYADCSRHSDDSERLAADLLEQAGVCVTPGKDFGVNRPRQHLRFAYTVASARLEQGLERLQAFLAPN